MRPNRRSFLVGAAALMATPFALMATPFALRRRDPLTIDGVELHDGDRVLMKEHLTRTENGAYVVYTYNGIDLAPFGNRIPEHML